jgi:hypothetical protein
VGKRRAPGGEKIKPTVACCRAVVRARSTAPPCGLFSVATGHNVTVTPAGVTGAGTLFAGLVIRERLWVGSTRLR